MGLVRSDSGSSFGAEPNRNTEWIKMPYFFLAYYSLLVLGNWCVFLICTIMGKGYAAYSWTIINILHSTISFLIMHWWKGVPFRFNDGADQGRYDKDTFWEQIDDGRQWTSSKKKFMIVPPILLILAVLNAPSPTSVIINTTFFLVRTKYRKNTQHIMQISSYLYYIL